MDKENLTDPLQKNTAKKQDTKTTNKIPEIKIEITKTEKISDPLTPYTQYTIYTKIIGADGGLLETYEVNRRFQHFLCLYSEMLVELEGYIIPKPCKKTAFGRFEELVVKYRRCYLEYMLNKMIEFGLFYKSVNLTRFLKNKAYELINTSLAGYSIKTQIKQMFAPQDLYNLEKVFEQYFVDKYHLINSYLRELEQLLESTNKLIEAKQKNNRTINKYNSVLKEMFMARKNSDAYENELFLKYIECKQSIVDTHQNGEEFQLLVVELSFYKNIFESSKDTFHEFNSLSSMYTSKMEAFHRIEKGNKMERLKMEKITNEIKSKMENFKKRLKTEIDKLLKIYLIDAATLLDRIIDLNVSVHCNKLNIYKHFALFLDPSSFDNDDAKHNSKAAVSLPTIDGNSPQVVPHDGSTSPHSPHDAASETGLFTSMLDNDELSASVWNDEK